MDGFRKMQVNSRERAISSDINTLQTYQGQDMAEMLRALTDTSFTRTSTGVVEATHSVSTAPATAAIFQGLLVQPQPGSNNILVSAGIACFINPDAAPNESDYKYIRDVGVSALGTLTVAPNAGASARVDVIECRINPVPLTSSQSRDIFDQVSGLFTAASVVKETQGRLEYRVRSGSVGGGYPAAVAGWLPLAVAVAPAGSANNDGVEFWDVRPMLQDRLYGPMNVSDNEAQVVLDGSFADNQTALTPSGNPELTGVIRANFNGWLAGGTCKTTVTNLDANYIHTGAAGPNADPLNPPAAFAVNTSVFACFPFGLPRWCRYNRTPLARLPGPFNGIPIVSRRPAGARGEIQAALPVRLNASLGFGAAVDVTDGVALVTAPCPNASAFMTGFSLRDRKVTWGDFNSWQLAATSTTATSDTFTLTENGAFPRNITKFGFFDVARFTAIPAFAILLSRNGFFSPSGYNIEENMNVLEWVPQMQAGQTPIQSNQKIYWQSIPRVQPDAGPYVRTFVRSWTSVSPTGFTLNHLNMTILGWEMR